MLSAAADGAEAMAPRARLPQTCAHEHSHQRD
jgi:hypothetical protein